VKHKVKIGDLFAIPLGDGQFVFGQVVANTNPKCYIIFDNKSTLKPKPNELTRM